MPEQSTTSGGGIIGAESAKTTPGQIAGLIKMYRDHLVTRILSRNLLLKFTPTKAGLRRMDFFDLKEIKQTRNSRDGEKPPRHNSKPPTQPGLLIPPREIPREKTRGSANFFQELLENKETTIDLSENPAIIGKMNKMRDEARITARTTGAHSLFLGWPFVCIKREEKNALAAPLLFFGINLAFKGNKLTISRTSESFDNYMLRAWLDRNGNQRFPQYSPPPDETPDKNAAMEFIKQFAANVEKCPSKVGDNDSALELEKYSADNAIPEGAKMSIMPFAVFGVTAFKYRTLLGDLKELANKAKDNKNMGLLQNLFGNNEPNPKSISSTTEADRYLVETSDPSQEETVGKLKDAKVMLIDGPPGSGKSQTIVNLIADSLAKRKTVALVCEKITALRVVEKRLRAKGLQDLVLTITAPKEERERTIKEIKDIQEDGNSHLFGGQSRDELSASIPRLEKRYDAVSASRGGNANYSVLGDLLGKANKSSGKAGFDVHYWRNEDFMKELKSTIAKTPDYQVGNTGNMSEFVGKYQSSKYPENKWKKSSVSGEAADEIGRNMSSLVRSAEWLTENKNRLPDKKTAHFLCHPVMRDWAEAFVLDSSDSPATEIVDLVKGMNRVYGKAQMAKCFFLEEILNEIYEGDIYATCQKYAADSEHLDDIAYINGQLKKDDVVKLFIKRKRVAGNPSPNWENITKAAYYWVEIDKLPKLPSGGIPSDTTMEKFRNLLEDKRKADVGEILSNYTSRQNSAIDMQNNGLLRLRSSRNAPATTLRRMFARGRNSVRKIFPVLLTTPDAMSQIFPLEEKILDVVIVDEASQMFLAEALPIMYRAEKLIVSGDKMQMPPAAFFALSDGDDDGAEENEPDEDIPTFEACPELLEAMEKWVVANSRFRARLNMHYRSSPAELFDFSNHAFYNGRMQTPPNNVSLPHPISRPIEVVPVAGKFEDSVNREEVSAIIRKLREIWSANPDLSVGIIVFNEAQKNLLDDALFKECHRDPEFKEAFEKSRNKEKDGEDVGLFYRSVQHVQGDERDVIIIGVTYGNESRRYGALVLKERGRRILNVAITRAKLGMYVICSIDIEQLPDEDRDSDGNIVEEKERWFFWQFLKYAQAVSDGNDKQAKRILRNVGGQDAPDNIAYGHTDSDFEADVAEYVREIGYQAEHQIGEAGFKIDIGVKIPEASRFLCGIECDGRRFHSSWRARYNDIWRQGILETKGWKIYRIWSDRWYGGAQQKEKDKLKKYLDSLRKPAA